MKNKIRIKKALVEAKFMAKPEDMDKLMPKLQKDDVVKLVDEGDENETAGRAIHYGVREPELSDDEREEINRPIQETGDVDTDKLRVDVAKLMEKLNLGQFENVFKKIDKPQEQAEVIAAFAERIGVPRAKLGAVLASMRDIAESEVAPIITKEKLEEFVNKQKTL